METNYIEVSHEDTVIVATDTIANKTVVIDKSISVLFLKQEDSEDLNYKAITYKEHTKLDLIETFIRGENLITPDEAVLLSKIYVRFGWLDKTLAQLRWVPLVDLVDDFVKRKLGTTEKGKFQEICKMLSLSIREARKYHMHDGKPYTPKKDILNTIYGKSTNSAEVV